MPSLEDTPKDPLFEYRGKRDFNRTPEPSPDPPATRPSDPVFVVHRHEARALHYDLRLEVDGVLWSFAVPKGFSFDPKEKRLAVRTEDHPIEYEHFDGVIPKGQYGAGTMVIWDRGTLRFVVEPDPRKAVAKGEIKVILSGRKLRGEWHLVKTNQGPKTWLLFKSKDRYAGPDRETVLGVDLASAKASPMPTDPAPMRPGEERAPFSHPEWVFEMSFAGLRAFAEKRGDAIQIRSADAGASSGAAPIEVQEKLAHDLRSLRAEDALLDGVLIALDERGRPSPAALRAALDRTTKATVFYYAFDLLHFDGFDLRTLPLVDRKGALRALLGETGSLQFVDHVAGNGEILAKAVATAGLPMMIAKRARSSYHAGEHPDWVKAKVDTAPVVKDVAEALSSSRRTLHRQRVKFTNLSKVYWPEEGFTKGDLIRYYEEIADHLLPYLRDRPVHMNRFPDGIHGKNFYQRHATETTPSWMKTVPIHSDTNDEEKNYILCEDRDSLLALINQGSIDLHPWMSRHQDFEHPDYAVLDLDPKGAPFAHVVRIAKVAGRLFRGIGLNPALKTSGKTGLHIVLGLPPIFTYEQVRLFLEGVARVIARELPEIATVERVVHHRGGKVYLDYLQNGKGQTVVPPYVARPARGATVSTPLHWDELETELDPSVFHLLTVPARVRQHGDLFQSVLNEPGDMIAAAGRLSDMVQNREV